MVVPSRPQSRRKDTLFAGRYRLGPLLGTGGMAEVYDAVDERLHRPVAVKVLTDGMAARPDVRKRFEAEARAAARLSHPNVVSVYDTGEEQSSGAGGLGTAWIVMERLPGETLADRMGAGRLDPDWLTRIAGDVLGALGAAHTAGIVHRDVKPGNILLGPDGCAKVGDFGIAKSLEMADDTTHTGQVIGTPAYLAPERIDGDPATPQADLYALGVVLYEALAGAKPFRGTTPVSVAYAVRHTDARPLGEIRPDLPPHLVAAVHRAMNRDPARRFASAADMRAALSGDLDPDAARAATVVAPPHDSTLVLESGPPLVASEVRPGPARRSPRARLLVVALVIVLFGLMALGMALAGDGSSPGGLDAELREAAEQLDASDGPRSREAATRLEEVAASVEADSTNTGQQANALLTDLAAWQAAGDLHSGAVARLRALLLRVPGADPSAFASPTTTEPPPPAASEDGEDTDDDDRGKAKGRKGDD